MKLLASALVLVLSGVWSGSAVSAADGTQRLDEAEGLSQPKPIHDGESKTDLPGAWLVNKERSAWSTPRMANLKRGAFPIRHDGQTFEVTRTFTFESGSEDTLSFEFPTDGREVVTGEKGRKELSSVRWLGSTLVLTTRFIFPDEHEVTNVLHYTLLDDGTTLLAGETVEGKSAKHHNLWLFDRQ